MHNTLTCWCCGKALLVDEDDRDAEVICPACGMSTRDTALQSGGPTRHANSTAVQAEPPMPRAAPEVDTTRRVDIRRQSYFGIMALVAILVIGVAVAIVGVSTNWKFFVVTTEWDVERPGPFDLMKACDTYCLRHGHFPPSLQALLEPKDGNAPLLEGRDRLLDDWGQPFQYDPKGPRNGGQRPDIWTVNPDDGTLIGNWPRSR